MRNTLPALRSSDRPLVPSDLSTRTALVRGAFGEFVAAKRGPQGGGVEAVLKSLWPQPTEHAVAAAIVTRAATTGAQTNVPAWAGALAATAVASFIGSLIPQSAAAVLFSRGIRVDLPAGNASINIPGRVSAGPPSSIVAEGAPIPVVSLPISNTPLSTVKVATIIVVTGELAELGVGGLAVFEQILKENAAISLDSVVFGSTSPGLLSGVVALPASANARNDLARLAEAVSTNGSGQVMYIAAAGIAAGLVANFPEFGGSVTPSPALPAGRIIAVDPLSIVSSTDPDAVIEGSEQSTLHMNDAPTNISTPGTPNVVAAPTYSMFQTNQIAMRMLLGIGIVRRRADCTAFINTTAGQWWPST